MQIYFAILSEIPDFLVRNMSEIPDFLVWNMSEIPNFGFCKIELLHLPAEKNAQKTPFSCISPKNVVTLHPYKFTMPIGIKSIDK